MADRKKFSNAVNMYRDFNARNTEGALHFPYSTAVFSTVLLIDKLHYKIQNTVVYVVKS